MAPCTSKESPTKERAHLRLPEWVKVKLPGDGRYADVRRQLSQRNLHTVCEEARCPNLGECWGGGTATFMILGKVCTRGCRFCDVITGKPNDLPSPDEPIDVAKAAAAMKLKYVVVTSVDRDDLPDGGAAHFVKTVAALKQELPHAYVELLTPDFAGNRDAIETVGRSGAEVLAQNVETVRRLTRIVRDVRCSYDRTLEVLARYRAIDPSLIVKTSLLLGMGETLDEVKAALVEIRSVNVDWITIGQYLRPTRKHLPVDRFVTPHEFELLGDYARSLGFPLVSVGPLVRSSYRAGEHKAQELHQQRRKQQLDTL